MKSKLAFLHCVLLPLAAAVVQAAPVNDGISIEIDGKAVAAFAGHAEYDARTTGVVFRDGWFDAREFRAWLSAPGTGDEWLAPGVHAPDTLPCRAVDLTVKSVAPNRSSRSAKMTPPAPRQRMASVLMDACPVSWTVKPGPASEDSIGLSELRIRFRELGVVR